jgi:hypothetical protein
MIRWDVGDRRTLSQAANRPPSTPEIRPGTQRRDSLDRLGAHYRLMKGSEEHHQTPSGAEQNFCWAVFQRI